MDTTTGTETADPVTAMPGAILYQARITPSSRKVRFFLGEKHLTVRTVDVTEGFGLSREYISRYVHGIVPMLELPDGTQIGEAMAICRYIDELYPDSSGLFGVDVTERAMVDMWERRSYLEGMAAIEEIFRNSHAMMIGRSLPGTTEPVAQIPALVDRGYGRLARSLKKFDERLSASKFLAGERFSVADITTACALDFGKAVGIDIPDGYKNIQRWHSEVSSRPSASA